MELHQNKSKKVLMLILLGLGIVAGILVLKYNLDSRSRAELLACIGQTSVTCRITPNGDTNLNDYTYDVQVIDKSTGLNVVPAGGSVNDSAGSDNSDGSKSFILTFNAGAGEYVCHVTAKPKQGSFCEGVDPTKESSTKVCKPADNGNEQPTPTIPAGAGGGGNNDDGGGNLCSCGEKGRLESFQTRDEDGVEKRHVYWTSPSSSNTPSNCQPDPNYCKRIQVYSNNSPDNPVYDFACVYCQKPGTNVTDPNALICNDSNGNKVSPPSYTLHQAEGVDARDYTVKMITNNNTVGEGDACIIKEQFGCFTPNKLTCQLKTSPGQTGCEPNCSFTLDEASKNSCNIPGKPISFRIQSNYSAPYVFDFDDDDDIANKSTSQKFITYDKFDDSGIYDITLKCFDNGVEKASCTQRLEIGCVPDNEYPTVIPTKSITPTAPACIQIKPKLEFTCKDCVPTPRPCNPDIEGDCPVEPTPTLPE